MDAICKAIKLEQSDLDRINKLACRELGADEVFTFAIRLCDNEVDRDMERFSDSALYEMAELFQGVPGIFDHRWSAKGQTARLYRTEVVKEPEKRTSDGRIYRYLKGWAYMMRTEETAPLIAEIEGGIKKEVSVGCSVGQQSCSICGQPMDSCMHRKGRQYDGRTCCGVLSDVADVYEWSFVAVPAQKEAGVIHKHYGGFEPDKDKEAMIWRAKARLEMEKIRFGGN